MQLATIAVDGHAAAAVRLEDGSLLDIAKAAADSAKEFSGETRSALMSGSMQALIEAGSDALSAISKLVNEADEGSHADALHAAADVRLLAPIPVPRKNVFCVGRNYAEHIAEGERAQKKKIGVTEHPVYFTKPLTAVIGPLADIPIFPDLSEAIDYEVELTIVIGKAGRNISKADAYDHIFGYTILNDITARDIQRRHGGQYFKGKALDGSCPIGPWIVTADAVSDPQKLAIGLKVNGETRQDGNTASMIFDIPTLIASLSEGLTLEPGDLIATGTPSGVGYAMDPPQFLKDGDTVVCEIAEIGRLENTVRASQ
ncbi:MAG: fumarylacetoacetate hydrolase family protein [Granulosicoccus sp.]|nr:fumarylacetoacetate hydrolase family protein [Granulosicoccus sp.]